MTNRGNGIRDFINRKRRAVRVCAAAAVCAGLLVCGLLGDRNLAAETAPGEAASAGEEAESGGAAPDTGAREEIESGGAVPDTGAGAEMAGQAEVRENFAAQGRESDAENPGTEALETLASETGTEETLAPETRLPELSGEEEELLKLLCEKMEQNDLAAAAAVLNENQEVFGELFYEKFEERPYLYDGEVLSERVEGRGIVFRRASTIFFGTFAAGKPEGKATALRALLLEEARYDYSTGVWRNGRMEGFGISGYNYYEGIGEPEVKETEKQGRFSGDLMDGEITYICTNALGNAASWHFKAEEGVTETEDRWVYSGEDCSFSLLSDDDESWAYVLAEDSASEVFWRNLVPWEE